MVVNFYDFSVTSDYLFRRSVELNSLNRHSVVVHQSINGHWVPHIV